MAVCIVVLGQQGQGVMSSAQKTAKKRRPRYDDEYRAGAVLMLEAAGYPDRKGALAAVSSHLSVPHPTLSRWAREIQNPPPDEIVHEKKLNLVAELTDLLGLSLKAAKDTVGEATYRELMIGVGILVDKVQLLTGNPTERAEVHVNDHRERLLADIARKANSYAVGEADGIYSQPVG